MTATEIIGKTPTGKPLPNGWRWAKLEELFDIKQGAAMSPLRRQGISPHPFLRTLNILWGKVDLSNLDRMDFNKEELTNLKLINGDLLVCEGGDVGRTAIWKGKLTDCLYQNHIHRLRRKNDNIDPKFYMLWMQAAFKVFNSYKGKEITTTIPNLSGGKLKSFIVPLPPTLAEQERISRILNEQITAVEKARTAAEARLEAAKTLPAAYLRTVFKSEEVKGWTRHRLGDVCEITAKQADPKIPEFADLPHVNGDNIETGTCRITYLKTAGELGMISGKYIFEPGDVLYSKLRPYLRKATVVDFRGVCSADMYPITVNKERLDPHFLCQVLVSDEFNDYADGESRRARMPKLNRYQLLSWKTPLPPLSVQHDIVYKLSNQLARIHSLVMILKQELETINALPATLLRRAFIGGL